MLKTAPTLLRLYTLINLYTLALVVLLNTLLLKSSIFAAIQKLPTC